MKRPKSLVTGGAGFIGSNLVDRLVAEGYQVTVLDNLSTGKLENIRPLVKSGKVRFIKGDIRRPSDCQKAVRGQDFVFHVAACRAVKRSVDNPSETNDVNVTGTLNILMAAREHGVKRVVFSSSSSVYGNAKHFPLKEEAKPDPQSPYAATKVMGEYYCYLFHSLFGLETVALRYFNVFGPRQNPESIYSAVIPIFLRDIIHGKRPEIHWDGKQSRDFSFVDNIVEANVRASRTKGVSGQVFNVACHEEYSVLDIFNELVHILGKKGLKPIFKPKRAGDVRRTYAEITKAKRLLGFKVQTRFKPGLKKTVDWFLTTDYVK